MKNKENKQTKTLKSTVPQSPTVQAVKEKYNIKDESRAWEDDRL